MKKGILTVFTLICSMSAVVAQEQKEAIEYNRWSIDANIGYGKSAEPYDVGYFAKTFQGNYGDLGIRYMLNNKFGLKVDYGYSHFQPGSGSAEFDTKYHRTSLQGVLNLGRVLDFETWTKRLNMQTHVGTGYSWMTNENFSGQDNMVNVILGLTGQFKITERIALNADFSMIKNALQNNTFNGTPISNNDRAFEGTIFNATAGISIYLGGKKQHADWYYGTLATENTKKIDSLDTRIKELETMLNDTDRDGVADYLDQEPNTSTGLKVDTKGRAVDLNNNGVADELEDYMDKTYSSKAEAKPANIGQESIAELMNGEYVNVYFDVNSTKPTKDSFDNINYVVKYLKANPSAKVELNGYADETGNAEYNKQLSAKRAETVKNIVVKTGIIADRLTIKGNGEDNSVDKKSKDAKKMVRRVSFKIIE